MEGIKLSERLLSPWRRGANRLPKQETQIVPIAKQRIAALLSHSPINRRTEMVEAGPRIPMRAFSLPMGKGLALSFSYSP